MPYYSRSKPPITHRMSKLQASGTDGIDDHSDLDFWGNACSASVKDKNDFLLPAACKTVGLLSEGEKIAVRPPTSAAIGLRTLWFGDSLQDTPWRAQWWAYVADPPLSCEKVK